MSAQLNLSSATRPTEARAERDTTLPYDDAWAVFDIGEHPNVPAAKLAAKQNQVELAVSNPCFERWALLHSQEQAAHIERDRAASALRKHLSGYEMRLDYDRMKQNYEEARRRAGVLERAERHGAPGRNPTTGVPTLAELIRRF